MTTFIPTITAVVAAVLGLLSVWLAVRVILCRVRFRVNAGDGGHAPLAQALRAHGNFVEFVPIALLLLMLAEWSIAWRGVIAALGVALVVARVASAWGLGRSLEQSAARRLGSGLTLLVIAISSLLILYRAALMI